MESYQIITDSCCDFTQQMYKDYRVACVPLSIHYQGQSRENMSEPDQLKAFYDSMRRGETATTSAANPEGWASAMEPILQRGQDILCLTFSSALSATCQSAVMAAEELREKYPQRSIRVVDTLCAALGQGLLIVHACRRRDEGMGMEELADWCEENKRNLAHWVTVDDLNHLKRGGRISAATALVGGMLNIKPIIHVDDEGRLVNVAKCRGRKAAMELLAEKLAQGITDRSVIAIAHGDCPEDAAALEKLIREKCDVETVITGYVGGVIGAHTGPGVLVVFYLGNNR